MSKVAAFFFLMVVVFVGVDAFSKDDCYRKHTSRCHASIPAFRFNVLKHRCEFYHYSGCPMNLKNNFETLSECVRVTYPVCRHDYFDDDSHEDSNGSDSNSSDTSIASGSNESEEKQENSASVSQETEGDASEEEETMQLEDPKKNVIINFLIKVKNGLINSNKKKLATLE